MMSLAMLCSEKFVGVLGHRVAVSYKNIAEMVERYIGPEETLAKSLQASVNTCLDSLIVHL
jgi:hypothetical protein